MALEFCTPPIPGETHKYYGYSHNNFIKLPQFMALPPNVPVKKKPEQKQKTIHAVASAGNLILLKQILLLLPDPLKAVNDPHPSTGLTPLHFAASRGHVDIVRCLIEEYSVAVDSRDKEGETALLKAAYNGHYHVVRYLQTKNANIHQKDKDGWTALHNACSRGYLPIVRLLIENGARVDVRSKMGHTPLINAASKGYMSIVEYLLDEAHADPLVKNSFGEAAYDVSAAAGESYICEMLQKAGTKWWQMQYIEQGTDPMVVSQRSSNYDLLDFHVTVMVVLHENQRATSILGLSKPQFSATALTKYDVKGPWSLHPSGLSCSKEEVRLPPSNVGRSPGGSNWFWLTDWQIDYSDPRIDPTSGWQYARSFDTADNAWTPVAPTAGYGWVRRRRWVRVMKRRMDLAKTNTTLPNDTDHPENESQGDYLYYAEEIMQATKRELSASTEDAGQPIRHTIRQLTKELRSYEEAVQMLLAGIKTDYNQFRKHQASILVTSYSEHIDKLNAQITELAPKLSTPISPAPLQHNEELARELGFVQSSDNRLARDSAVYNNEPSAAIGSDFDANPWSRLGSNTNTHSQSVEPWQASTSVLQHDTSGLHAVDLLGHNDPMDEFTSPLSTQQATQSQGPRPFAWEADLEAKECRRCSRRFGLLVRRHHCRRCGLIVCDKCSSSRAYLAPSEILQDPASPLESVQVLASQHQRVCDKCYADLGMSS